MRTPVLFLELVEVLDEVDELLGGGRQLEQLVAALLEAVADGAVARNVGRGDREEDLVGALLGQRGQPVVHHEAVQGDHRAVDRVARVRAQLAGGQPVPHDLLLVLVQRVAQLQVRVHPLLLRTSDRPQTHTPARQSEHNKKASGDTERVKTGQTHLIEEVRELVIEGEQHGRLADGAVEHPSDLALEIPDRLPSGPLHAQRQELGLVDQVEDLLLHPRDVVQTNHDAARTRKIPALRQADQPESQARRINPAPVEDASDGLVELGERNLVLDLLRAVLHLCACSGGEGQSAGWVRPKRRVG